MRACLTLFCLIGAASALSSVRFSATEADNFVDITSDGATQRLSVPQHCRASTCNNHNDRITDAHDRITALADDLTDALDLQFQENGALRKLIKAVEKSVTTLATEHDKDVQEIMKIHREEVEELEDADAELAKIDGELQVAIESETKTPTMHHSEYTESGTQKNVWQLIVHDVLNSHLPHCICRAEFM